jgi:hypothetical protein
MSLAFAVGSQRTTSAFKNRQHQILKIFECFVNNCSCHVQGEYAVVGRFGEPFSGQPVGGELDVVVPINDGEEEVKGQYMVKEKIKREREKLSPPLHIVTEILCQLSWSPKLLSLPLHLNKCRLRNCSSPFLDQSDSSPLFRSTNQNHHMSPYLLPAL